jgi:hypothetical protein
MRSSAMADVCTAASKTKRGGNKPMATLKELMGEKNRGDGRKFTLGNDRWFEPMFKDRGGEWSGLNEDGYCENFSEGEIYYWEELTPPKQKKKVKMYRPIFCKDDSYRLGEWRSFKKIAAFDAPDMVYGKNLTGWQEMQVEVDE